MITCSVCGELKKPSAFYRQGDSLTGKKKKCKRCHQGLMKVRMRRIRVRPAVRAPKSPELLTLHAKEKALDEAWSDAARQGHHKRAVKIRARYDKVDARITRIMKGAGNERD
jgi:ssDNA-binding Zn-finger/Zn-ribbon topoisomerase 1